jgi:hypothetical protein
MQVLQGAWVGRRKRTRNRGRGTMKRGRRMSSLPLHQRTLERFEEEIQEGKEV